MKMKKLLALVLAGTMMASLSMVASASTLSEEELEELSESFVSGSSVSENSVAKSENEARADREAKAEALAAEAIGIPLSTIYAARAEDKEIGEYISNSVYKVAGIDVVTPVAQGGDVIVDGEKTNITFTIDKPYYAYVKPALAQAAAVGGTAINVVDVKAPVRFSNAVVNFYTPGVTADQNIQIFQYVNGTWASVTVNEVREDHVVANLTAPGVLVFVNVQ
ncbi:hypothetical protein D7V94_09935 [Parablautia intestinalis]|uniref:Uncharacterized protein n=1 Tax=Parablautia intestinalis TaxID=2320100 RepID=A0A3A9AWG4_9FIRM|nr:hypothetical protein [Parablautia intestinalis]RKI91576.1 hypothetical protein D7V94_09935 [Parablautia intestinalis]